MKQAFDWAYSQLSRAVRANVGSTLSRIVQVDQDTISYRDWIKANHPLQDILEDRTGANCQVRLTGMVNISDRGMVPVVSAHDYHSDTSDRDSDEPADSDRVSSVSCRSASPDQEVEDNEDDNDNDNNQEEEEEEEEEAEEPDSSPEGQDGSLSPELVEDSESSPGTGRNSPQATPNSAMSISPANSEVGSRLGNRHSTGSSSQTSSTSSLPRNTPYVPRAKYAWGRNKKGLPDRADLDSNWRASASGPGSDKSSTSSGEREVTTTHVRRSDPAPASKTGTGNSNESRADLDTNWRDHINSLPPSGAKTKYKNKNQKVAAEKGIKIFNFLCKSSRH